MLKGHVQIELHNHKTGLRDRIEQDNLVTNAVPLIANALAGRGKNMNLLMPLATTAYGGLMIFEDPLTESVNNFQMPGNSLLTAYAGQTLNTSDALMGSINQSESGPTENGYEHVWEFNTSQANGLVSCLSLTHSSIVNYTIPHIAVLTDICDTSNKFYVRTAYLNSGRYTHTGPNESFRVGNKDYYAEDHTSELYKYESRAQTSDYLITDTVSTTDTWKNIRRVSTSEDDYARLKQNCFWGMDGYIYYIDHSSTTINMYRASIETTDPYEWSNRIINTSTPYDLSSNSMAYPDALSDGKFFRNIAATRYVVDDYNTGTENEYIFENPVCISPTYAFPLKNGGVLLLNNTTATSSSIAQITGSGNSKIYRSEVDTRNMTFPLFWNDDCTIIRFNNNRTLSIPACYLGTIANIEHPFEKTNTVSMKVKYRLTQV